MSSFANVIVSRKSSFTDKIYDYSVPPRLSKNIRVGSQVLIPFGKRKDIGYVVGLSGTSDIDKVKDIIDVTCDTPLFDENSVKLAKWMSEYYMCFFISALRAMLPPGIQELEARAAKGRPLKLKKEIPVKKIRVGKPLKPTADQKRALDMISGSLNNKKADTMLLYGITGSGKTEVYLQAAAEALKRGRSSIILVPEVGLTSHLIERFRARFEDHLAVFHSEMTMSERRENWSRVSSGYSRIVLGTRSAVFAPAKDIGLMVLDEEYETTYKQEQNPRYHARDVARFICGQSGAVLILGSATPSLETYYRAEKGEYLKASLPTRIDERPLPPVEVVDMRKEPRPGVLSGKLRKEIKRALSAKEQVILFMNRRGYYTFAFCRECGEAVMCPKCSLPLVMHMSENRMRCGHCGFSAPSALVCGKCRSSSIHFTGVGTQRIEREVAEVWPGARILRIDRDTVKRRGSAEVMFSAFRDGKADVLIGTQYVTKGLDVARVTLVGIVSADTGLNLPDFTCGEHTFQLITQVAGRAGRHHLPGKVILQTHNPDHYVIKHAALHDYEGFFAEEIGNRRSLGYPPFGKIINIIVSGKSESAVEGAADKLRNLIEPGLSENDSLLGPSQAPRKKLKGSYRWQILVKGPDMERLRKTVVESLGKVVSLRDVRVTVDVDPVNMM